MNDACISGLLAMASLGLNLHSERPFLEIAPAPFEYALEAAGTIDATGGSPLAAPTSPLPRQLLSLRPEGELVTAGKVVAEFDPAPLEERIAELRVRFQEMKLSREDLAALQATRRHDAELLMDKSQGSAALAEIDFKRLAYDSRLQILQSETGLGSARRRVDSARNQLALTTLQGDKSLTEAGRQADAILKEIEDLSQDIPRYILRAENSGLLVYQTLPVAGQVRKAQAGDFLEPGQIFGRIPSENSFVGRIHLDERQAVQAKIGLPVEIHLRSRPGQPLNGSLIQILPGPKLLAGRGNRPFQEALVKLPPIQDLKIGESLTVRIPVRHFQNVYAIPKDYLDGASLWVAGTGRLQTVKAEPLFESDNFVLYNRIPGYPDGSPVRIVMPPSLVPRP